MTEEEAQAWIRARIVPRETWALLERFVALLREEATQQNLVARSTLDQVWGRHIVDSLQLLDLAPADGSAWLDIGSGAGFPGVAVACVDRRPMTLAEPRKRRVAFLEAVTQALGLADHVVVAGSRVEDLPTRPFGQPFGVISARAVAPLDKLFAMAWRFSDERTKWLLPKGKSAQAELDAARLSWQGVFRVEQSVTDPGSAIIVAERVRPAGAKLR